MTTPRPDSRLGSDLGPYRIERVLGRGGMGVVYLATQRELGRKVALKLLPDELAHDTDFRARFERESRLAAAIDHPNVIPLYEAGEVDGVLFLAMRYVEGTDLATRLREGPLPTATAIEVLAQVAGALDAAHEKGLVHRDVKPGNVLLDRTGSDERPHAYLTDFGLTKQAGSETGLTRAGAFLGTPAYMAPEQVDGTDVDGRADQYALGCLAFEMLTGRVPFVREKEVAVALAHLKDPVPSAVALRPELPATVDTVFGKAMAKDLEARYPTCAAFADDLRTAVGGGAVAARPIITRRRTPLLVAAVAGLVLVAVAGLALASGLGGSGAGSPSPSGSVAATSPSPTAPTAASTTDNPSDSPIPESSAFPDAAEAVLLAKLPKDLAAACRRIDAVAEARDAGYEGTIQVQMTETQRLQFNMAPPRPTAGVMCEPVDGADRATFLWYQFINDSRVFSNATDYAGMLAKRWQVPDGECGTDPVARESWSNALGASGTLLCFETAPFDGAPWISWSFDGAHVLAFATRDDRDFAALHRWFEDLTRFLP